MQNPQIRQYLFIFRHALNMMKWLESTNRFIYNDFPSNIYNLFIIWWVQEVHISGIRAIILIEEKRYSDFFFGIY